jgi:hypothetical protein
VSATFVAACDEGTSGVFATTYVESAASHKEVAVIHGTESTEAAMPSGANA